MRASAALLTVLSGALLAAGCQSGPGFAVEVTIRAGEDLDDPTLRGLRDLAIHVDGSEAFDARYPIGDQLRGQVGRWLYVPSKGATEATFELAASDAAGEVRAVGASGVVLLRADRRSQVEVVLRPPGAFRQDLAGEPTDLGDDGGDAGVGGPDMTPLRTLDFGEAVFKTISPQPYNATWLAIGPVDGVAGLDIVAAVPSPGTAPSLLLNNGDGSFQTPKPVSTNTDTRAVALGKLDGDAFTDLVVLDLNNNRLSVYLGQSADGTFAPATHYGVGANAVAVVLADLDGDGDLDAAVTNQGSDNLSVLYNDQTGHFPSALAYAAGTAPGGLAVGQLVGDGKPELVVVNSAGDRVSMLLNDGMGAFPSFGVLATAPNPRGVAIGDVDGDGRNDVVVACGSVPGKVSVLRNQGNGTFATHVDYTVADNASHVAIGDLDHDGTADLVVSSSGNQLTVLLGREMFAAQHLFFAGPFAQHVALADLDSDGLLDIAVAGNVGVGVLLNRSTLP